MAPKPKLGKKREQDQEPAWEYVPQPIPQQIIVIEENWVACDNCQKWRKLPKDYIVAEDSQWYCKLSPDLERNSCTSAEEAYPEDNPQPLLEVPMLVPQPLPQIKKEVKKQSSAGKPAKGKGNGQAGWNSGKGGADKWGARDEDDYDDDGKDEDDTEDDDYMDSDKEEAEPGAKAPPKKKRKPTDYEGGYGAPKQSSWSDPMKAKQRQAERPHRPAPAAPTGIGRSSSMVAPTMSRSAAAAVAAAAAAAAAAPPPPEIVVAPAPKTFENVSEELQELETACKRLLEQGGCWTPPAPNQPASAPRVPASQSLDIPHWLWQGLHYFAQEASAVAVTAFESLSATEYAARENGQEVAGVSSGSVESGAGAGGTSAGVVMPSAESYARMALLVAAAQALPGVQAMAAAQPPPAPAAAVAVEPPQAQRVGVGQAPAGAVIVTPQGAPHAATHHSASVAPVPTIPVPTIAAYSAPATAAANLHPAPYTAPAPIQPQAPSYPLPASHAAAYTAPAAASHTAYSVPTPATQLASYPTIVPNTQAATYSSAPASAAGLIGGGYPVLAPGAQAAMFTLPPQTNNLLNTYSALAPAGQQIPTFTAPLTASQMAPLAVSTALTQPYTTAGMQLPFNATGTTAAFAGGQVPFYNPGATGTVGVGQLGQLAGYLAGNAQMAPSLAGQTLNALAAARAVLAPGGQGVGGFGSLAPGMQAAVYPALANLAGYKPHGTQQHQQSSVVDQQHVANTWQQQGTAAAPLPPQKPALLSAPPTLRPAPLLRQQQQQQQLYPLPDQMQALLQQQQRQQLALQQQQKLPQQMQGQQQQMNSQQFLQQQYMQQLYLQKAQQNRMNVANAAAASAMASATAFSQQQPGVASTAGGSSGGAASTTAGMPLHGTVSAGGMDMSGGVGGNKIPFVGLPPHLGMDFKSNMVQPVAPFPAPIPAHLQAALAQHQQLQPSAWSGAGLVQPSALGSTNNIISNNSSSMQLGAMMQQGMSGATGSNPAVPTSSDALFMQQLQILAAMPASTSAPMTMTANSVGGFLASMQQQQPPAPLQQPVDK